MLKESIPLDDTENCLLFVPVDMDGFQISEVEGNGSIYVYYEEIPLLIQQLRRVLQFRKNQL